MAVDVWALACTLYEIFTGKTLLQAPAVWRWSGRVLDGEAGVWRPYFLGLNKSFLMMCGSIWIDIGYYESFYAWVGSI